MHCIPDFDISSLHKNLSYEYSTLMKRKSAQIIQPDSVNCIWSKAENKALKAAVKQYSEDDWESVANYIKKNRTRI